MEFWRGLLSSLITLIAIPLLLVATLSFVVRRTVFSEEFIKNQIEENQLYDGLANFVSSSLKEQIDEPRVDPIIDSAVTTQRVREAVEPALTKLYGYLAGATNHSIISVDLTAIKGEINQSLSRLKKIELDQHIPDRLTFGEQSDERSFAAKPSSLERIRGWYSKVNLWSNLLPFAGLGLLVLLFAINTGVHRLRRPAYVLLVVGLILGIVGGIAAVLIPMALRRLGEIANLPILASETIDNFYRSIGGDISRLLFFAGLGFFGLAIIFFFASMFLRERVRFARSVAERLTVRGGP